MSSGKRWVAINVDMIKHPLVGMHVQPPKPANGKKAAVHPGYAWLSLVAAAAWRSESVDYRNTTIALSRGELIASRAYWAEQWNWGEQAVRGFFVRLADDGMIVLKKPANNQLPTIVSICNYDKYQFANDTEQPTALVSNQQNAILQPTETRDSNQRIEVATLCNNLQKSECEIAEQPTASLVSNQHDEILQPQCTSNNTNQNNIINFSNSHQESAREQPSPVERRKRAYQSMVANDDARSWFADPHARCRLTPSGKIEISDELRSEWLTEFNCDDSWLDLALRQAAGFVQRHSATPLEARVASQIAQQAKNRLEQDKRYNGSKELAEKQKREKFVKEALRRI